MTEKKTVPMDIRHAPQRVWFKTEKLEDGSWMWGSREWRPGEKRDYERTDLVRPTNE